MPPVYSRCLLHVGVLLTLLMGTGCRPTFEASDQAHGLPLLDKDPVENGREVGRWPAWRGNGGCGVAAGGSPPTHFSDTDGFRWKVAVPGRGNSSPVVWDDYVLLCSAIGDDSLPELAVLCFARRDGKLRWQATAGKAIGTTHEKNGYAAASVATDGQRIVAFFGSTGLFCYDFSGKRLWHAELGDLPHQWGTASSPVLYQDKVIQLCDYEGDSFIAAFDKQTGHELWRTGRPSHGSWSTPVVVQVADNGSERTELVVNGTKPDSGSEGLVIAYDPDNGRELWRVRGSTDLVTPTPVVYQGLVYCASGRNGPIMAIEPGGSGDGTGTHMRWKAARGGPYIPSPLAYRNRLFVLRDEGSLNCYDAGSGQRLWTTKLPGVYTASLVAADGRLYATSEQGVVSVVAAKDSCELLARNALHAHCLATPAVADGELLLRTQSELFCFPAVEDNSQATADTDHGRAAPAASPVGQEHAAPANAPVANQYLAPADSPAIEAYLAPGDSPGGAGSGLAVQDSAQQTVARQAASTPHDPPPAAQQPVPSTTWPLFRGDSQATGVAHAGLPEKLEVLWTFSADQGGFESTAAIAAGLVVAAGNGRKVYGVDFATGKKRWEFSTALGFSAAAAVRDGSVYLGDIDGQFYCLDAQRGTLKWKFEAEGEIDSCANFFKDRVLFGSQDSNLYCLDAAHGKVVWKYQSADQIRCFPTLVDDRTFVAGCDGNLHIVDVNSGQVAAKVELGGPTGSTPAVMGDMVFVGTEDGTFYGIDWKQANTVWHYQNAAHSAPFRASAAVTPAAVLAGSRDKTLYAFDPKTGRVLWTFATKSRIDSSPVVVGNRAFFGSADGRLYAVDVATGKELWRFEAGGAIVASAAVAGGRLVIGTDSGDLYCFGAKDN
jgi:outer membrane protein assembly factor BamB